MTTPLTLDIVRDALSNDAAAFRARTRLQPVGGPGDKVFPPTFGDTQTVTLPNGSKHKTKYAVEVRRIDGASTLCVLLDSVASQANRMEEALQDAWDAGSLSIPMVRVDFTGATHEDPALDLSTLGGDGYITALEAPHRLADALLRDSTLDGLRFRASEPGRALTLSTPKQATPVYTYCPTALVFGMWDSTGPKGGSGAKFQRALVSEIIGVNVDFGRKSSSRIDPVGIEKVAGPIFEAADPDESWTLTADDAKQAKGKPVEYSGKGGGETGRPSSVNHSNITPSIDFEAGGVTLDYAEQITVLSLPALRRLRFATRADGERFDRSTATEAASAAHVALAALGLAAVALHRGRGFDLRSRCAMAPEGDLTFELVGRDGSISGPYTLTAEKACDLVDEAAREAEAYGLTWSTDPVDLQPAPKLVELIRRSRLRADHGEDA